MNQPDTEWEVEYDKLTKLEMVGNAHTYPVPTDYQAIKGFIRKTRTEAYNKGREDMRTIDRNSMAFIGHLQHRCPQCGEETLTSMSYLDSYEINALWGRCFKCATSVPSTSDISVKE